MRTVAHEESKQTTQNLLSPGRIGPYTVPHRIVMAPLTRNRATDDGDPTEMMVEYYLQRASAAWIVTEATPVSRLGHGYPNTPGIHSEEQVEAWRRVTSAVHEAGGRIFLQLWHVGRISHPVTLDGDTPVAPSAITPAGNASTREGRKPFVEPRALETDEVREVVEQFRTAAKNARDAGFDGVEIHGANGYILDQFLRDGTNRREDRYGGSVENRARFLLEVTEAVAGVWGADRVGVRLSPLSKFNDMFDSNPEATFTYAAERLGKLGLAYLHVVEQNDFEGTPQSFNVDALARAFDGTYVVNGGYDRERGDAAIASGRADFVAYGRPFLANPDLPERYRRDALLNEPDPSTFYGGDERGYTDYPFLDEVAESALV